MDSQRLRGAAGLALGAGGGWLIYYWTACRGGA
jgi:hypothetical protein